MKVTVTERMFCDMFATYNREGNFSSEGLSLLFSYLEQLEKDTGHEMELDVIGLCCDYSELTFQEFAEDYGLQTEYVEPVDAGLYGEIITVSHKMRDEELKEAIEEYISEKSILIGFTDTSVVFRSAF